MIKVKRVAAKKVTRKSVQVSNSGAAPRTISRLSAIEGNRGTIHAKSGDDLYNQIIERVKERVVYAAETFHLGLLDRTPVYTGRTVANYNWTLDEPIDKDQPFSGVPPGPTSKMTLGSEPNRPQAEAAATETLDQAVSSFNGEKDLHKLFLTNATEYENGTSFLNLEYGGLPGGMLGTRVPPTGIYRGAKADAVAALETLK